jgi:DNA polymerase
MSLELFYHPESDAAFWSAEKWIDHCDPVNPYDLRAGQIIENVGITRSTVLPSMDFETYSEAGYTIDHATGKVSSARTGKQGGLPLVGTPNYATHPSAAILSLGYDLKNGQGRKLWIPGSPEPRDLLDHIFNGGMIEAWNSTFEWWIWNIVGVRKHGWPLLPLDQTVCVMSRSRRFSLPGGLDKAATVLGSMRKDPAGKPLIQKLTRPHSLTKSRRSFRRTPQSDWADFAKFYDYNLDDVKAEDDAAARIPDLSEAERRQWLLDQTINARGVQVDVKALDAMLYILEEVTKRFTLELCELTGGAVGTVNETASFLRWLGSVGVLLPDMQAETIESTVAGYVKAKDWAEGKLDPATLHPLDPEHFAARLKKHKAYRALEIRQALGSANIKKLYTIKLQVSSDGRLRDQYIYCGADRTGRASSGGAQLQNITSKGPKSKTCNFCGRHVGAKCEDCPECMGNQFTINNDWTVESVEYAISDIMRQNVDDLIDIWGDVVALMCGCLRGLFIASKGKKLICVDFSAIEAVAAACLSRCQWRIEVFNTHGKIYEQSAANATGISFAEILQYKKDNGMHHPARKTIGKVRELAAGYGGWIGAFLAFGAGDFMTDAEIKADILKWRAESPEIERMWGGQYSHCGPGKWDYKPELFGLEGMAIKAILNPGECFHHIDISYAVYNDVLFCRLPSGRFLHYHKPRLTQTHDKLGRDCTSQRVDGEWVKTKVRDTWQITFEGHNSNPQKGPVGWQVLETYGGRLFENVDQAVSADIQFLALERAEAAGYAIVMHTHDEGCAEVPEDFGSVEDMCAVFSKRPAWASWWPLKAAGWTHQRYQKD